MATSNIKWKEADRSYRYIDLTSVNRENHAIIETTTINADNAPSRAQKLIESDDVIFATTRPTLKRFTIIGDDYAGEVASTGYCVLRADRVNAMPKWVYYCISTTAFNDYVEKNQKGSAYPAISDSKVKAYKIPLPSIEEQNRIVAILFKFDALVNDISVGLPAELNARKKQYEYYRNQLLTFDRQTDRQADRVRWITLNEIGKVSMCKRIFKNETLTSGDIPFYKIGTFGKQPNSYISRKIYDEYRKKYSFPKKGDVLLSASGTIGRRVIYNGEPAYFQDSNIVWIDNDESKVLNKFLYYLYAIIEWRTEGGTIQRLYNDNLKKIQIPVPPLSEQEHIIAILDKFDALVNDISIGLPAELNARRKQYEYYRNQLLTFDRQT